MKNKIYYLIVLIASFFCSLNVTALPTMNSAPSSAVDGLTLTINGDSFGVNTAVGTSNLEWLGDNIEDGTDGATFSATNWDVYWNTETTETAVPQYDSTKSHSGDQCIIIDYKNDDPISRYRGHFYYDYGSAMTSVYLTFWVLSSEPGECTAGGSGCQWKIWRINMNPGLSKTSYTNYYQNHWTNNGRENRMRKNVSTYFDFGSQNYLGTDEMPPVSGKSNKWTRMELWIVQSSVDTADGSVHYWYHNPEGNVTIKQVMNNDAVNTRELDYNYRYLMFGHVSGIPNHKTYWDDLYVQAGTRARVEIGDASTWAACKHREIQVPISWSDDSITFNFNQGSFSQGDQVYLFVVDNNGVASAGKGPITIEGTVNTPQKVQDFKPN